MKDETFLTAGGIFEPGDFSPVDKHKILWDCDL